MCFMMPLRLRGWYSPEDIVSQVLQASSSHKLVLHLTVDALTCPWGSQIQVCSEIQSVDTLLVFGQVVDGFKTPGRGARHS